MFIKRICCYLNRTPSAILYHCSRFHFTPLFRKNKLALAVIVALSWVNAGVAADYTIEEFPEWQNWTISDSVTEGFTKKEVPKNAWGDRNVPFEDSFDISSDTLVCADNSNSFASNNHYFFLANNKELTFNLRSSTLRIIDEAESMITSLINVRGGGSIAFLGDDRSSLQISGQMGRAIFANEGGKVKVKTGDVWVQHGLSNDRTSNNTIQVTQTSSLEMNVTNDLMFLTDLNNKEDAINAQVLNYGTMKLDAKRIFSVLKTLRVLELKVAMKYWNLIQELLQQSAANTLSL